MNLPATAEQTVGPFFQLGFEWLYCDQSPVAGADGHIIIEGQVFDGTAAPVADAVLEFWCGDTGNYPANPQSTAPRGFQRVATDTQGHYTFTTQQPRRIAEADGRIQAPHFAVIIFMRGVVRRVISRVYLPDSEALPSDPVLNLVPRARRHTLIGSSVAERVLRWDVHMQGSNETVFFEF